MDRQSIDRQVTDEIRVTSPFVWDRHKNKNFARGIRIGESSRGFVFVRDDELLPLANAIADYLTEINNNTSN